MKKIFILLCVLSLCFMGCGKETLEPESAAGTEEKTEEVSTPKGKSYPLKCTVGHNFSVTVFFDETGDLETENLETVELLGYVQTPNLEEIPGWQIRIWDPLEYGDEFYLGQSMATEFVQLTCQSYDLQGVMYTTWSGGVNACFAIENDSALVISAANKELLTKVLDNIADIQYTRNPDYPAPEETKAIRRHVEDYKTVSVKENSQYKGDVNTYNLIITDSTNTIVGYVFFIGGYDSPWETMSDSPVEYSTQLDTGVVSNQTVIYIDNFGGGDIYSGTMGDGTPLSYYDGKITDNIHITMMCHGDADKTVELLQSLEATVGQYGYLK